MTDFYNTKDFQKKCEVFGIYLSDEQITKFMDYYELLTEWNTFMNLTAITDFDEVVLKHFVDSLAVYRSGIFREAISDRRTYFEEEEKAGRFDRPEDSAIFLIDIGTGAGFPGIPLKIVFPELRVVLLDSLNKRVKFLNTTIENLCLKDIEAVHGRAEDLARSEIHRQQYDFCVSRAVANFSTLSELCIPFVKNGGYFISYKSEKVKEELYSGEKAVEILGGRLEDILEYKLPGSDIGRSLLLIRKEKDTPKKFPRKAGTPLREPLS